jgi:hypothetical protein
VKSGKTAVCGSSPTLDSTLAGSPRSAALIQQPSVMEMPLVATAKCEIRRKGILLIDFMPPGTTINSDRYCDTLRKLRQVLRHTKETQTGIATH